MNTIERTFEAFKVMVPYLRGALWWAQNDLIKDRQREFNQEDDHVGHPLLSVSNREVEGRFDVVPMLVGTSGVKMDFVKRSRCILVEGMTEEDRSHKTYFGSIVMPGCYSFEDLMTGVRPKKQEAVGYDAHSIKRRDDERGFVRHVKWHQDRTMMPNWDKPKVSDREKRTLDAWCAAHGM